LAQVYDDKNKTAGVQYTSTVIPSSSTVIPSSSTVIPAKAGIQNKNDVEAIYQRYLQAFKKGVFDYIKEDQDPLTQEVIPRKYFSGGFGFTNINNAIITDATIDQAQLGGANDLIVSTYLAVPSIKDQAMLQQKPLSAKIVEKVKPLLIGPGYDSFEDTWAGEPEQIELFKILARELKLTAPVVEIGRGENTYPARGLNEGGVARPIEAIDIFPRGWFSADSGVDAGGFIRSFGLKKGSIKAVVFNYSLPFIASESKVTWREPLSWINSDNYYQIHSFERWSRVNRAFNHAWDALEPGGWIIISTVDGKFNKSNWWRQRVTNQSRQRIPLLLNKIGFSRIQIIENQLSKNSIYRDESGVFTNLLILAQKPLYTGRSSDESGDSAQLADQAMNPPDIRVDNRGTQEQREAYSITLRQIVWAEKMERIINALEVSRDDIQDVVVQLRHADALNQILNISEKPVNQFIYSTYKETVFQYGDRVVVFRWQGPPSISLALKI
jgi:hypothetical protein